MRRFFCLAAALFLASVPSAHALTLINDTGANLQIMDPTATSAAEIPPDGQFEIPELWGDSRHKWFSLSSISDPQPCEAFRSRWGSVKMPAFS